MRSIDFKRDLLPCKDRLFRLAMSILLDSAEAEDTVEDTLLRVWEEQRQGKGRPIDNLTAYLITICRNLALDRAEKRSAQNIELTPEHDRAEEDNSELRERYDTAVRLIHEIDEPQRSCLILRDIEGRSYQEIADILHLSEAQVKVYIHRGRQRVRERYEAIKS